MKQKQLTVNSNFLLPVHVYMAFMFYTDLHYLV